MEVTARAAVMTGHNLTNQAAALHNRRMTTVIRPVQEKIRDDIFPAQFSKSADGLSMIADVSFPGGAVFSTPPQDVYPKLKPMPGCSAEISLIETRTDGIKVQIHTCDLSGIICVSYCVFDKLQ